jgi:hypothetical protein
MRAGRDDDLVTARRCRAMPAHGSRPRPTLGNHPAPTRLALPRPRPGPSGQEPARGGRPSGKTCMTWPKSCSWSAVRCSRRRTCAVAATSSCDGNCGPSRTATP